MNQYELGIVLRSSLTEEEANGVIDTLKTRIGEFGGEITGITNWGKRRLAHPIHKQTEGIFSFLNFTLSPQSVKELVRMVQFTESIIRHILVKNEKKAQLKPRNQSDATPVDTKSEPAPDGSAASGSEVIDVQAPSE